MHAGLKLAPQTSETSSVAAPSMAAARATVRRSLPMHRHAFTAPLALALAMAFSPAHADGNATKDEAMAMVKKGVAFIRANGKDKGYAEISAKGGKFSDRDLYLVVYGLDGTVHAHGAN